MPIPWEEISKFGRKAVLSGLTSSRFGNISVCQGDKIFITATGSMLDELDYEQIVEVDRCGPSDKDKIASSEINVHRAIYSNTIAAAIVHTHSPFAVALSLLEKEIIDPIDSEGIVFLGPMPIVEGHFGSNDLAKSLSYALISHNAAIARGHGVFATGKSLTEAFTRASMAEHSAQVRYLVATCTGGKFISLPLHH